MKFSSEKVGENLRQARERAGFTQTQVARLLDMRRPSIGEIERGQRPAKAFELDAMAKLYGARSSFLTEGIGPKDEQLVMLVAEELAELRNTDLDRLDRAIRIVKARRSPSRRVSTEGDYVSRDCDDTLLAAVPTGDGEAFAEPFARMRLGSHTPPTADPKTVSRAMRARPRPCLGWAAAAQAAEACGRPILNCDGPGSMSLSLSVRSSIQAFSKRGV